MSPYAELISEVTEVTDPAVLTVIEELMRADRTSLDDLMLPEFRAAVMEAVADAAELEAAGQLAMYCDAIGIAVPAA